MDAIDNNKTIKKEFEENALKYFDNVFNLHLNRWFGHEAILAASKALPDERNFNKGQSRKQQLRKKLTADNQRKQAKLQSDEAIASNPSPLRSMLAMLQSFS